jgi:hypothetical protein
VKHNRLVETSISILSVNDDGIGLMHFKDGVTVDIPEQMEHLNGIIELTDNHHTPFVVTAGNGVTFTKDARENALIVEDQSPVCASAIVVQNLAYRLLAEFYIKIQKPKTPYKLFTSKEKAFEWCKQFVTAQTIK